MAIYGLSQSNGVERMLDVTRTDAGILLVIRDRIGDLERARIVLPPGDLLTTIMERSAGNRTIEGMAAEQGQRNLLDIEVRGNEVLLCARADAKEGWDAAVGLDDFQDALERILTPA